MPYKNIGKLYSLIVFALFHDFRNKSTILITLYDFLIVNKGGDPGFEYPLRF